MSACVLAAPAVPASADTVIPSTGFYHLRPSTLPDSLALGINDGSTTGGAQAVQWYQDYQNGSLDQSWHLNPVNDDSGNRIGYQIQNINSGQCLTNEYPFQGALVYQEPCTAGDRNEVFKWLTGPLGGSAAVFQQISTGYVLDVDSNSYDAGARIDLWYYTGYLNQQFYTSDSTP